MITSSDIVDKNESDNIDRKGKMINYDDFNNSDNFNINVLEKRVFALEHFLGSSSNIFDIERASFQNLSPGSTGGNNEINSSMNSAFPLIESIAR